MRIPKKYGQSQTNSCPFCSEAAYSKNPQGVPVCRNHAGLNLPDLKCVCGGWLDVKEGKWGVFYVCMECGPVNSRKMMEINGPAIIDVASKKHKKAHRIHTMRRPDTIQERVREKIRKGEPLTPDELEFL